MNTLKFSPARRMFGHPFFASLPTQMEDMFNGKDFAQFVPSVNLAESKSEWLIELSAPGFSKEDFKINLDKNLLTISAEHKTEVSKDEKEYTRREFSYGSFKRSFRVKEDSIDAETIRATYENGILNVSLPKKAMEPEKKVKEIRVG